MPQLNILSWWRPHKAEAPGTDCVDRRPQRQSLSDHFGLVAGLLLLACAMLWALGEHSRHKAELRLAETSRHIAAFEGAPVADSWRHLSGVWQAQQARQRVLLQRIAALSGEALEAELYNYRAFVIDTVTEHDLAPDIATVIQFYRRLASCIRIGSCDADLAAGRFGSAAWSFRDQHYYYLQDEYQIDEIDRVIEEIAPGGARRTMTTPW
jgi:hypothetical protein